MEQRMPKKKKKTQQKKELHSLLLSKGLKPCSAPQPEQAGILRLKYGGIQGGREGVPAFEPLSDPYSLLLSAWEHKFPDADRPARTQANLSAPK